MDTSYITKGPSEYSLPFSTSTIVDDDPTKYQNLREPLKHTTGREVTSDIRHYGNSDVCRSLSYVDVVYTVVDLSSFDVVGKVVLVMTSVDYNPSISTDSRWDRCKGSPHEETAEGAIKQKYTCTCATHCTTRVVVSSILFPETDVGMCSINVYW